MNVLEEGNELALDFNKIAEAASACNRLVPVAVQNADTNEVVLLAYTNEESFRQSIKTRKAVFWSTSRNKLWEKGKTSGNMFDLVEIRVNCEQNALLYRVRPQAGGICHTENSKGAPRNCFYRQVDLETLQLKNTDP